VSLSLPVFALLGALTWSLLEYVIHRWIGHGRRFRRNPAAVEHIRHHVEGDYFAPTWKKVVLALLVSALLAWLAALLLGAAPGVAYVVGLMSLYGAYEALHRREHTHPGIGAYGRWARRHHFFHHFENGKKNHGVTSPLWDLVFGTYQTPGRIRVPERLCMRWLRDPATGAVRREHAHVYSIAARG
jgi:sterol desaturase/sphingolipid hydroxylase (fatty acid hydroxylase superfamily)